MDCCRWLTGHLLYSLAWKLIGGARVQLQKYLCHHVVWLETLMIFKYRNDLKIYNQASHNIRPQFFNSLENYLRILNKAASE
jgi:hypothetical protein